MPIIKPEVGKPIVGTLMYADQADGNYGMQLKLSGEFDGLGKGVVYMNHDIALGQLRALGVLTNEKPGRDGKLSYNVVRGKRIVIIKDANKHTNVSLESGNPPPGQMMTAHSTNGTGLQAEQRESPAITFKRKVITFARCVEEAKKVYLDAFPTLPPEQLLENIQSGAACLFIEANKAGLLAPLPPGPVKPDQLVAIESLQMKLAWTTDILEENVAGLTGGTRDPLKLTDQQAKTLIGAMNQKLAALEQKRKLEEENRKLMEQRGTAPIQYENQDSDIPW